MHPGRSARSGRSRVRAAERNIYIYTYIYIGMTPQARGANTVRSRTVPMFAALAPLLIFVGIDGVVHGVARSVLHQGKHLPTTACPICPVAPASRHALLFSGARSIASTVLLASFRSLARSLASTFQYIFFTRSFFASLPLHPFPPPRSRTTGKEIEQRWITIEMQSRR